MALRPTPPYNEAAFRHFLTVDWTRARRSRRCLYLVLVAIREAVGRRARLNDDTAAALFRALRASVREIDIVGWYQERYVVAAVLAQSVKAPIDAAPVIADRVEPALRQALTPQLVSNLRVRVIRLGR